MAARGEPPPSEGDGAVRDLLPPSAGTGPGRRHRWTAESLGRLVDELDAGPVRALGSRDLAAWNATVEVFLDPASPPRRTLDPLLGDATGMRGRALQTGLEAALGGWRGAAAGRLVEEAADLAAPSGLLLLILSSNLPGLAVQPLLPALALGRRVLVKSPGIEPWLAPAFLRELFRRRPALASGRAATVWPGGDRELEDPVLRRAATVLAYGGDAALADLRSRTRGTFLGFGPRASLAVIGRGVDPATVATGLAADVALFDQRGCLSIQAVYVVGAPEAAADLAGDLAAELAERARTWPPGPPELGPLAEVRGLREEAALRGLVLHELDPAEGTVVVETRPELRASPGLRFVRVHPLRDLGLLPRLLEPWRDRLQGAALAGDDARSLEPDLRALGVSRVARPGELQSPDAAWANGGLPPLALLAS